MSGLRNFNPSLDALRRKYGGNAADVYGRIYRYAQMPAGYCYASQKKIARALGLSRTTVNSKIKLLIEGGYLEKLNQIKGRSLSLRPTGKAEEENGCVTPNQNNHHQALNSYSVVSNSPKNVEILNNKKEFIKQSKENIESKDLKRSFNQESNYPSLPWITPEIKIYIDLTGIIPDQKDGEAITETIRQHGFTKERLKPYWDGWTKKSYNPHNLAWLKEWAVQKRVGNKPFDEFDPNKYTTGEFSEFIDY
ncbi:helix-turn-helix domain-containing protein [bacterium]|nr:helix-turn-helix domain-containing protein [bacterium]